MTNPIFFCIGTDRSTGDALGPLVGSKLQKLGYEVFGTIHEPVHAMNLTDYIAKIPEGRTVIAVDAMLGKPSSVGKWHYEKGSIKPGSGVGKELAAVGDYHITGVVNIGGFMEYFVLQNTRLSLVMDMADEIVDFVKKEWPLPNPYRKYHAGIEWGKVPLGKRGLKIMNFK